MIQIVAIALVAVVFVALLVVAGRRSRSQMHSVLSEPVEAMRPAPTDPLGKVVDVLRRRRWARWSLSGASLVMVAVAIGLLGYPFYTNLYQARVQQRLDRELVSPELEQAYRAGAVGTGDALTRIKIEAIDVDVVVVEGTTMSALRAGAGHYPQTPLPCEPGNVGIAGHRTTYGKPFHNLDLLKPGDTIVLETPIGSCTYRMTKPPFVVMPGDTHVVGPTPVPTLTLTTCHPKGSAAQRLIVQAELVGETVAA
ncbi:MAG TPA: class E sortase [Acidimicrobiales bacterium]|nr:class E sortase [Acidimicrobiales bacterium]